MHFAISFNPLPVLPGSLGFVGWMLWLCRPSSTEPDHGSKPSKGGLGATAEPACPGRLWRTSSIWKEEGERLRFAAPGLLRGCCSCDKRRETSGLSAFLFLGCFWNIYVTSLACLFARAVGRRSGACLLFSTLWWPSVRYLYGALF